MAKSTRRNRPGVEDASLAGVIEALSQGTVTASGLARAYLARIKAYDRGGPKLNSVREVNPDALKLAARLDGVKPSARQPLAGVPILVKDNIATGDRQHTTAGSLALEGARARGDATVVRRLRERSEEHTSELQSLRHLVCRLLLEKKKNNKKQRQI